MTASSKIADYQSYRGLPTLAGLATMAEAARPGLGVEACVARLKRFHYAFRRLHEILTARITAEPIYELKTGFSHHAYLCAEHVQALRTRVGEMREPPLGLEVVPDPALEIFFDEILAAPTTGELLVGLYEKALPALDAALARHLADTNPLTDAPSVRVCRFARLELADMIDFGRRSLACLVDDEARAGHASRGSRLLDDCLAAAGGLDGTAQPSDRADRAASLGNALRLRPGPPARRALPGPLQPGRQRRGVPLRPGVRPRPKALMMLYKRLREIDVPEMMASIIHETKGKPWDYYRDMSPPALGRGPPRDDGRGRLRRPRRRLDEGAGSPTTGRSGSTPSARRSSGTRSSTSSSRG